MTKYKLILENIGKIWYFNINIDEFMRKFMFYLLFVVFTNFVVLINFHNSQTVLQ